MGTLASVLVTLRFDLGNAEAYERAGDPADGRACGCTAQRCEQRAGVDEGSEPGDGERANSGEQTERASDDAASARARDGPFGRLGVVLMREVFGAALVREENGDVVVRETSLTPAACIARASIVIRS